MISSSNFGNNQQFTTIMQRYARADKAAEKIISIAEDRDVNIKVQDDDENNGLYSRKYNKDGELQIVLHLDDIKRNAEEQLDSAEENPDNLAMDVENYIAYIGMKALSEAYLLEAEKDERGDFDSETRDFLNNEIHRDADFNVTSGLMADGVLRRVDGDAETVAFLDALRDPNQLANMYKEMFGEENGIDPDVDSNAFRLAEENGFVGLDQWAPYLSAQVDEAFGGDPAVRPSGTNSTSETSSSSRPDEPDETRDVDETEAEEEVDETTETAETEDDAHAEEIRADNEDNAPRETFWSRLFNPVSLIPLALGGVGGFFLGRHTAGGNGYGEEGGEYASESGEYAMDPYSMMGMGGMGSDPYSMMAYGLGANTGYDPNSPYTANSFRRGYDGSSASWY